jgi:hypothetical protein
MGVAGHEGGLATPRSADRPPPGLMGVANPPPSQMEVAEPPLKINKYIFFNHKWYFVHKQYLVCLFWTKSNLYACRVSK